MLLRIRRAKDITETDYIFPTSAVRSQGKHALKDIKEAVGFEVLEKKENQLTRNNNLSDKDMTV